MPTDSATPVAAAVSNDERVQAAERAYAAGDFAMVRALTAALLSASSSEAGQAEQAERARALRARVAVDPVALGVLAFAFALLCVIVYAYAR
jgi:hypothetical protein